MNKILIFILILFIILVLYKLFFVNSIENLENKIEPLINKIITIKSARHYRIGDIFYNKGDKANDSVINVLVKNEFNDSIMKEYLIKNDGYKKRNLKLLKEIVLQKTNSKKYPIPDDDELVIHIRAGDVIVHDWFLKKDYIKLIEEKLNKHKNIKKCSIVICLSWGDYKEKNKWIFSSEKQELNLSKINNLLIKLIKHFPTLKFDIISNADIDKDFVYMVNSKYFIKDIGGFSQLADELRNI